MITGVVSVFTIVSYVVKMGRDDGENLLGIPMA